MVIQKKMLTIFALTAILIFPLMQVHSFAIVSTTTTLVSSPNPSALGSPVTFTATVNGIVGLAGVAGSTVIFSDAGSPIGPAVPIDANGLASFTTSTLSVGSHPIIATFVPSAAVGATGSSSSPLIQVVNSPSQSATKITLLSQSPNPSLVGAPVTFDANVAFTNGATTFPTGTVTFSEIFAGSNMQLGSAQVDATNGHASFTTSFSAGSHSITATFAPTAGSNAAGSTSSPLIQVVNNLSTITKLGSTPNPSIAGAPVTFDANVFSKDSAATPSGTVTFSEIFAGSNMQLGQAPINPTTGGHATFTTSSLTVGSHSITATFIPDAGSNIDGSSDTQTQVVNVGITNTPTTTGSVTILGTCGLQFASGSPISYGSLVPGATSAEQTLVLHDTGSISSAVMVNGGNWLDSSSTNQMNVDNTKFSLTSGGPGLTSYNSKTSLATTDQTVGTVNVGTDVNTFWQLQVNLLSSIFTGSLTQTMTFTATC